jgi:eukaryotic-like serine/threonine-protein kinase
MSASTSSARLVRLERNTPELPRYQLVSRIATGGMAEVFLALMSGTCGSTKPVVIKRLWPELARDPEHFQMFLDEVRLSLCLHHPNVIHAYESGSDGNFPYLAMEYLDGQSFKHILDRVRSEGGLSLPLSLKIICDVLAGLEYVHSLADLSGRPLRIVHCDVSPQNVFVTCDGSVRLIDFGIAQSVMNQNPPRSRGAKGRVAYMAPEQLVGESVDHRADLFSVGVMLWEAAVGQRLWHGLTDGEIMQHLLSQEPPPRLPRGRGFPPGLAAICARALALNPNERYASAAEFQSDLTAVSTGSMPAQTRLLGGLVTRVFASSRALSRTMILQSLPAERPPGGSAGGNLANELPAYDEDGDNHRSESAGEERPSGSFLATMHDDITQVGPLPLRTAHRTRWLPWTAALLLLAAAGLVGSRLLPDSAHERFAALVARPPNPPKPAPSSTATEDATPTQGSPELTQLPPQSEEPRASSPPSITVGYPIKSWMTTASGKRVHPAKTHSVASADVISSRSRDVFDTPMRRVPPSRPARAIDHEDPYGP